MKTEFLKGLGLSDEDVQKILAENGKDIEREKAKTSAALEEVTNLKEEKQTLADKVTELSKSEASAEDYKAKLEELQADIKAKEEKARLEAEDKELTTAIMEAIGNKKFSSDYAKEGVIRDMKNLIARKENKGKSYTELFEELIKDRVGILANPNPAVDIPIVNPNIEIGEVTKEQFAKMGYNDRNKLFNENRELYNKLNKE